MERFIIANNTAFRYYDSEKGDKVLLLIHGYLESIETWEGVNKELTQNLRVVSIDVPGHGISEVKGDTHTMEFLAETIHDLLIKIGVDKVSVLGHSMGGYIALAFARLYPDMVENVIIHHSTPDGDSDEKRSNREREIALIKSGKKELLATVNPGKSIARFNRKRLEDTIIEMGEQVMITEDEGIVALLSGMMVRSDENNTVELLGERAMFIFGKGDDFMTEEYCQTIAKRHPKATVEWFEQSGHCSHIEEPNKFTKTVSEYIKRNLLSNNQQ